MQFDQHDAGDWTSIPDDQHAKIVVLGEQQATLACGLIEDRLVGHAPWTLASEDHIMAIPAQGQHHRRGHAGVGEYLHSAATSRSFAASAAA